jgi:hypothetical protein
MWRSLKYELIYPGDFAKGADLFQALDRYFRFYNYRRPHCPDAVGKLARLNWQWRIARGNWSIVLQAAILQNLAVFADKQSELSVREASVHRDRFECRTALMLKCQQPGSARSWIDAHAPVISELAGQLEEMAATTRAVRVVVRHSAEGFIVRFEASNELE